MKARNVEDSWKDGLHRYKHMSPDQERYMEKMDTWLECLCKLVLLAGFVVSVIWAITNCAAIAG